MADGKSGTKAVSDRIDLDDDQDRRHWAGKFVVSEHRLREAVEAVGPVAADVAKALGKSN
jgi:hypothetical protein